MIVIVIVLGGISLFLAVKCYLDAKKMKLTGDELIEKKMKLALLKNSLMLFYVILMLIYCLRIGIFWSKRRIITI